MSLRCLPILSVVSVLWAAACATPPPQVEPTEPSDPFGVPRLPKAAAATPATPAAARGGAGAGVDAGDDAVRRSAEIERAEVDAFLANGPGWFIRQVSMEPARMGDKFVGFRIVRFFEGDPRFEAVDLRAGDVVIRVNDMPIGKPDQFMKAWEDVKAARKLAVEYVRGGSVRLLQWDIVDESEIQPQIVTGGG